jgi:hypothetical protein
MGFPLQDNIPDNLKGIIINNTSEHEYIVYRIARTGIIEESTFDSTYTDIEKGTNTNKIYNMLDIGTYATSCFTDYYACLDKLQYYKRRGKRRIIKGLSKFGLCQKTIERSKNAEASHVDWWIYKNCEINLIEWFQHMEENDCESRDLF